MDFPHGRKLPRDYPKLHLNYLKVVSTKQATLNQGIFVHKYRMYLCTKNNCEQSVSLGVQFSILDPERFVFQTLLSPDDSDGGEYQSCR